MTQDHMAQRAAPWRPIPVDARLVLAAGITPVRMARWAMEKRRDGKPDAALRLLAGSAALVNQEAILTEAQNG